MPGLTFVSGPDTESAQALLRKAIDPPLDGHHGTQLWSSGPVRVVATTYPGYPLHSVETSEYWMCLEGGLYGLSVPERRTRLTNWASSLLGPPSPSIPRSLRHTDGDFIFAACHKSSLRWAVVNDIMGRLPLYLYAPSEFVCLTRDFPLFNRLPEPPSPDRLGAAQQLTFGYPLGRRTLREHVERVPSGTVLRSGPSASAVRRHRISGYNFDAPRRYAGRSITENAHELVERLDTDAQARCRWSDGPSVLALSGGLDSRSIACSLARTNCSFEATTFARPNDRNASDVEYAKQIAECFDLSHDTIPLPSRTSQHLHSLLQVKGGLNPFDVSYMIPYLETLSSRYEEGAHLLTGDGGSLLRDLQPSRPLHDENDLLQALLDNNAWLDPETAAPLVRVRPDQLLRSIRQRLAAYPESSLRGQYVHFAFERFFKYSFEGEDRNRSYLWSSAPYYGLHFTQYALHCPYGQKENYRLYRTFLRTLSERTLQIGYSDFYGFRMTDLQYTLYRALRWCVRQFPALMSRLRRGQGRFHTHDPDAPILSLLQAHLTHRECDLLNRKVTTRLLNRPEATKARALDNLLTVALSLCPTSQSPLSSLREQ